MDTITTLVRLPFASGATSESFEEEVPGHVLAHSGWVELDAHATFAPLAPGDAVEVDHYGHIIGVRSLTACYTMEATLHLPRDTTFGKSPAPEHPAMRAVAETEEDWRRAAYVTRNTAFSMLVSSRNLGWLEDNVEGHPYVEHVQIIRRPQMRANLAAWLANPAFS